MTAIRVGLAGYGVGGSVFHAPLIAATAGLRLTAVATRRRENVERDWPGVRIASSAGELASDPEVDMVVISTPTTAHFDGARAALEGGKHVVVDKPFTATVEEADELIHLARRRGLLLSVYQNRRWDGGFLTVERLIRSGELGEVYHFESHFDRFRPAVKGGWRDEAGPGSGILYDLGAHLVDQALRLFGLPDEVWADAFCQRPGARAIDYFHVVLSYGRRRAVLHGASLVREPGPHFAVHGSGGSFLKYGMDPQEDALRSGMRPAGPAWGAEPPDAYGTLVPADGNRKRIPTDPGDYPAFYRAMAAAIRSGSPVPVDPLDSRHGIALVIAAGESARDGRRIRVRP